MKFTKTSNITGSWLKATSELDNKKAILVSEAKSEEGKFGPKIVAKIRVENGEPQNVNLNKPTMNALIDAFGDDSKNWISKSLFVETEKMTVSGRRITALYLIPDGYEL